MAPLTVTHNIPIITRYLLDGRLVAFPTGTSYGLAADTQQGWALQRLRNLKRRPTGKTFTVFLRSDLWDQFLQLTSFERALLQKMASQPLTLLVKPAPNLAHLAYDGLVGLRVIDHPLMQQLAAASDVPLTATSANRAGEAPCFSPAEIQKTFANPLPAALLDEKNPRGAVNTTYDLSLAAILDGGVLPKKEPTTIAQLVGHEIKIIRPGPLKF